MLNRIHSNKEEAATKYVKCDFKKCSNSPHGPIDAETSGKPHHEFGSWGSMASASITNVFSPMEKQSLALCVFLISGGGRQRRRAERDRNSSLFICVSSPSPPRQPHLPLNILSPWVFFSSRFVGIMTPCPLQNLKNPMVSNSAHWNN